MASVLNSESRRLYSWWWDSHITPKNSKWLQENLTDMDAKVRAMIKLVEEDADSFARRAEMYYKKRPELMKLIEEFYRAYRALAERYDYATGELRHAQRALIAAFPDQIPFGLADDSPGKEQQARQVSHTFLDPDKLLSHEISSEGKVQKGEFFDMDKRHDVSESERVEQAEREVRKLTNSLAEMLAEKESLVIQYQQGSVKLANAVGELNCALDKSKKLGENMNRADKEVDTLKEALGMLEAEKDAGLTKQKEYLEVISGLEESLSDAQEEARGMENRAGEAEREAQDSMNKSESVLQYRQCLDTISLLENKITAAEEEAQMLREQSARAQAEVEQLRRTVSELNERNEALRVVHEQCLEKICKLEYDLSSAQEDVRRLNDEILTSSKTLQSTQEVSARLEISNQSLKLEADDLAKKIMSKDQELCEKHEELEELRMRYVQVEAALKSSQTSHARSQEEQRALALELESGLQMLKDMEACKYGLEQEMQQVKDENRSLTELNLSSTVSMKNMETEIAGLRQIKERLEAEGDNEKDNKELVEKCTALECSLISVNCELEGSQRKVEELRNSCQLLHREKSAAVVEKLLLLSQLHIVTVNMQQLTDKNAFLENSLSTANIELYGLRENSKGLEELCQLLNSDKANLVAERSMLTFQLEGVEQRLEIIEERYTQLEKEKEAMQSLVQELRVSLSEEMVQKQALLTDLEKHVRLLQDDNNWRRKEFQEELDEAVMTQFENFMLQKFVENMEERNRSLMVESEKHVEAAKLADKLISELETENHEQQFEGEMLLVELENLKSGIYQVFLSLEKCSDGGLVNKVETEHVSVDDILSRVKSMKCCLTKYEDDKQRLLVENKVMLTFLQQLDLEVQEFKFLMGKNVASESDLAVKGMTKKCEESEVKVETLQKLMVKLSNNTVHLNREIKRLCEVNGNLEMELDMLHGEIKEQRITEEKLVSELQERENDFELWDAEATSFFFEIQVSNIRDVLFENKVHELTGVCECLEGETGLKDREIEEMKEKMTVMESEIKGLRSKLHAYTPVIGSLKEKIASLEHYPFSLANLGVADNQRPKVVQDVEVAVHPYATSEQEPMGDLQSLVTPTGSSDQMELQSGMAVEKGMVEDVNIARRRSSNTSIKLKSGKGESSSKLRQQRNNEEKLNGSGYLMIDNLGLSKAKSEVSGVRKGVLIRDIPLDQVSDGSPSMSRRSRSRNRRIDDQMIERWHTAQVARKISETGKKLKRLPYEQEFAVNKLEVPGTEKSLKKRASDAQKLANLGTTVKDLMKRLETRKKSKRTTGVHLETMKEQLLEVEENVLQMESMSPCLPGSERIERLHLEVQKIQYMLLKLDERKGKSGFSRTKSRTSIILRDFIHHGRRSSSSGTRKKTRFCGCLTPSTKGDGTRM